MATVGELKYWRSHAKSSGNENWLIVKMDASGIGAGIISNGVLHRGTTGLAGEIAHIQVDGNGPRCACGLRGCLTSMVSAPVLLERARANLGEIKDNRLQGGKSNPPVFSLQDFAIAAQGGNEFVNSLLLEAGDRLGRVVAGVVSTLNPKKVLMGGRFARMGPLILLRNQMVPCRNKNPQGSGELASIKQNIYGNSLPLATHAVDVDLFRNSEAEATGTLVYAFERLIDTQYLPQSAKPVLSVFY